MNQLFNLGYDLGRRGYPWKKYPPALKRALDGGTATSAEKSPTAREGR